MWETRGKLLETVNRLLDENKQLRAEGAAKDKAIETMTGDRDKVLADLKKALEENKDLQERIKGLKRSLAEVFKQVRDQTGADLLLLSFKEILKVLGKHDMGRGAVLKEMSEIEKAHKKYDLAQQRAGFGSSIPQQAREDMCSLLGGIFGQML